MNIPSILVDTTLSSRDANPTVWQVAPQNMSKQVFINNPLLVYKGHRNKGKEGEIIPIQAIGRAAKEGIVNLYTYIGVDIECMAGWQNSPISGCPAFHGEQFIHLQSPIGVTKFSDTGDFKKDFSHTCAYLMKCSIDSLLSNKRLSEFEKESARTIDIFKRLCDQDVLGADKKEDAFHIWAAEVHNINFFVTTDYRLVNAFSHAVKHGKIKINCKVMKPSEIAEHLKLDTSNIAIPDTDKFYTLDGKEHNNG